MFKASDVDYELTVNKDHCFKLVSIIPNNIIIISRIVTAKRTYYIYANSSEDCEQWVELLRSKVVVSQLLVTNPTSEVFEWIIVVVPSA